MREIEIVEILLSHIKNQSATGNQKFIDYIAPAFNDIGKTRQAPFELADLYRVFLQIKSDILSRLLPGPQRDMCIKIVDDLEGAFAIKALSKDASHTISRIRASHDYMLFPLRIMDEMYLNSTQADFDMVEVEKIIEQLSRQIANADQLGENEKSLVSASLELVRRASSRARYGEVSAFRDEVYCAVGRLELNLRENSYTGDTTKIIRRVSDDLLRIAGMIELSGHVVGMISYASVKLITHTPT
ncbi:MULTISPECIES: hypothetical protein [Hyphomonas]|jgi:hypothetical protein|uniref:hypothetical protein n=1 Tax=Hyphomonas TaxID=85 RepID=UPI0035162F57